MRAVRVFLGADIGTGGVRLLAATESGEVVAASSASLPGGSSSPAPGWHEQAPDSWWESFRAASRDLIARLEGVGRAASQCRALAVDGTSGTLVCVDASGRPVRPAIMYNDGRATAEAETLNALAGDFRSHMGYEFAASFALAKMLWVRDHEAEAFRRTARCIHQADYIVGWLTGDYGVTDYSNALKTGYDLAEERWPDWIGDLAGVRERLPRVAAPGVVVGEVSASAASETGLPAGMAVVSGVTDGTAAFLASGAHAFGDLNTTLGTTLVFKALSPRIGRHPQGLVYSHKLPRGRGEAWLPGGASNTGCEWIEKLFAGQDPAALDARAADRLPSQCVAYPLARRGERFPFLASAAQGFWHPAPSSDEERFAAGLQGVAMLERWGYDVLETVTGVPSSRVFSTGGGCRSRVWMQCRADAVRRTLLKPACPESAFGAAVLAAAGSGLGDVLDAARRMVRIEGRFEPDPARAATYDGIYARFRAEMSERGYG